MSAQSGDSRRPHHHEDADKAGDHVADAPGDNARDERPDAARDRRRDHDHIDRRLDEALDESFPASDPPAVSLHDDPPAAPRVVDGDVAARPRRLVKRVLAGGALAAAGVFITRMILRRSPKRRLQ
jgi:hypothetical protein